MTKEEIIKFIAENPGEPMLDFYDKAYEKLKDLNRRIDRISMYLIALVFIFLVASNATISSFSIGPISITDISLISNIIPVVFSWQLLDLVIISGHKSELHTTVKFIFLAIYKQDVDPKDLETGRFNLFSRIIMPFSYTNEILKFSKGKVSFAMGCLGGLLFLPLILLVLAPFYFEYHMLKEIYQKYYFTLLGKICFYTSLWMMVIVIYYYLNTTILTFRNQKAGKL